MGDGTAQERGSPPRGSRSSGERGRLPENHTRRAGSVGEAATANPADCPLGRGPPASRSQRYSPISVFRHWPEAVSQIRLQSNEHSR